MKQSSAHNEESGNLHWNEVLTGGLDQLTLNALEQVISPDAMVALQETPALTRTIGKVYEDQFGTVALIGLSGNMVDGGPSIARHCRALSLATQICVHEQEKLGYTRLSVLVPSGGLIAMNEREWRNSIESGGNIPAWMIEMTPTHSWSTQEVTECHAQPRDVKFAFAHPDTVVAYSEEQSSPRDLTAKEPPAVVVIAPPLYEKIQQEHPETPRMVIIINDEHLAQ